MERVVCGFLFLFHFVTERDFSSNLFIPIMAYWKFVTSAEGDPNRFLDGLRTHWAFPTDAVPKAVAEIYLFTRLYVLVFVHLKVDVDVSVRVVSACASVCLGVRVYRFLDMCMCSCLCFAAQDVC